MTIGQGRRGASDKNPMPRDFRRDRRGAAATEFALILPFALVLFTGAITYSDAIAIQRKVTLTAHTVTDLVTQYSAPAAADITTVLNASAAIAAPYTVANMVVTVSEVGINSSGVATVVWSQSLNGTKRPQGQVVSVPATLNSPNVYYILGEVSYIYTPAIGYQVTGPLTLKDQTYMSPRLVNEIPVPQ
jgi:Flp pilus assembly protein TadG